jgi:hypothetical protein
VSESGQLKDKAGDYAQQHPEQVKKATQKGEEGIEHALGIEQEGNPPPPEQGEAQQGNKAKGASEEEPSASGQDDQQGAPSGDDEKTAG